MICAAGAVVYMLMIYHPVDGHLMSAQERCSQRECLTSKRNIVNNSPVSKTISRAAWERSVRCTRK